jgi:hypothetical protein
MRSNVVRRLILVCAIVALPVSGYAQEAVLSGAVTDATGGVLPGVTVRAVHEASGNSFEAVTDGRGDYRIAARIGVYRITAELQGFNTATRSGIELLVGQTAVVSLQMSPSGVAESVTVSAEAPLVETTTSSLGGTIDPRQVSELPSQGRNWMSLALLAPGNRTNTQGATPVQDRIDVREFQLNVDGQQVTSNLGTGNQSRYSNDSIAEFQFISNRFDATQGRSSGVQVNVITKSGTNNYGGSFLGSFRNSVFNAEDPVLGVVLPYSNQQFSGTFGGPIVQNKLHFFGNYEYERQPLTSIWNTPFPVFNVQLQGIRNVKLGGVRLDEQLSSKMRLMGKVSHSSLLEPFGTANLNNHPSATNTNEEHNTDVIGTLTQVLSNRALNELRVGYASYGINQVSLTNWSHHWQAANGITTDGPAIDFRGFRFNRNTNLPRYRNQNVYTFRDDFTFSYEAAGRHDLKVGGEYLHLLDDTRNCRYCGGLINARGGPRPANIEALFPDAFNADTWNLAAISSITTLYTLGVSDSSAFLTQGHLWKYGAWAQDDWKMSRLTLNLGVRYDLIWNAFAQNVTFPPFLPAGRPQDAKNIQPRVGFAYQLSEKTVVRGGVGLYYNDVLNSNISFPLSTLNVAVIDVPNDGRADFAANPFNGPPPTYAQAQQRFCDVQSVPGCLKRALAEMSPIPDYAHVNHSWQNSIGVAHQFGNTMAMEADYVNTRSCDEKAIQDNVNVTFNPATGVPYPYSDVSHRAFPLYGIVGMSPQTGQSDYHGLQTSFTKRMSRHWQASLTYTLAGFWTQDPPPLSGFREVTFPVAADLGGERSLGEFDQRHRLVFNGIWQVWRGLQVSGVYFYGSGQRTQVFCGCDARGLNISSIDRLRLDGTIIPREAFVGQPIHRVEMRLQERVPLGGRRSIDGYVEVFNLFNRANYGLYNVTETSPTPVGQPITTPNLSYGPRTLQLGFRLTF